MSCVEWSNIDKSAESSGSGERGVEGPDAAAVDAVLTSSSLRRCCAVGDIIAVACRSAKGEGEAPSKQVFFPRRSGLELPSRASSKVWRGRLSGVVDTEILPLARLRGPALEGDFELAFMGANALLLAEDAVGVCIVVGRCGTRVDEPGKSCLNDVDC